MNLSKRMNIIISRPFKLRLKLPPMYWNRSNIKTRKSNYKNVQLPTFVMTDERMMRTKKPYSFLVGEKIQSRGMFALNRKKKNNCLPTRRFTTFESQSWYNWHLWRGSQLWVRFWTTRFNFILALPTPIDHCPWTCFVFVTISSCFSHSNANYCVWVTIPNWHSDFHLRTTIVSCTRVIAGSFSTFHVNVIGLRSRR